jgi:hypothetical protein
MINKPQTDFSGINMLNLDQEVYFYLRYKIDYDTNEYIVFQENNNTSIRVGTTSTPIKWYEYVNP